MPGSNLIKQQEQVLQNLTKNDNLVVTPCYKKSGATIIKRDKYTQLDLDEQLSDKYTYKRITPDECRCNTEKIQYKISSIISKHR